MTKRTGAVTGGAIVLLGALANGCALGPPPPPAPERFDLGPPRALVERGAVIPATLLLPEVSAPAWLDGTGIVYRLSYDNAARPQAYANSRWLSPPAALLTQRLRGRLAAAANGVTTGYEGAQSDYALRVDLEDFSQSFTAPNASRVTMRARASLVRLADRTLMAQRVFQDERPAPSSDARGAAAALAGASDEVIERVTEWAGEQIRAGRKR